MQTAANKRKTATKRSQKKNALPLTERAAITPREFAQLFGHQTVWGYRQIYAHRVAVLTQFGRMMIPRSEVQRLLGTASAYADNSATI